MVKYLNFVQNGYLKKENKLKESVNDYSNIKIVKQKNLFKITLKIVKKNNFISKEHDGKSNEQICYGIK